MDQIPLDFFLELFLALKEQNRDGDVRLFAYDQPFVINALLSQQLSKTDDLVFVFVILPETHIHLL